MSAISELKQPLLNKTLQKEDINSFAQDIIDNIINKIAQGAIEQTHSRAPNRPLNGTVRQENSPEEVSPKKSILECIIKALKIVSRNTAKCLGILILLGIAAALLLVGIYVDPTLL